MQRAPHKYEVKGLPALGAAKSGYSVIASHDLSGRGNLFILNNWLQSLLQFRSRLLRCSAPRNDRLSISSRAKVGANLCVRPSKGRHTGLHLRSWNWLFAICFLLLTTTTGIFAQGYFAVCTLDCEVKVDSFFSYFGIGEKSSGKKLTMDYSSPDFGSGLEGWQFSNFVIKITAGAQAITYAWNPLDSYFPDVDSSINIFKVPGYPKLLAATNTIQNKWNIVMPAIVGGDTIFVDQFLTPIVYSISDTDSTGLIRIHYRFERKGIAFIPHTIALEHKYDIYIGHGDVGEAGDQAKVAIPGSYADTNCIYDSPADRIPSLFMASENGFGASDPGLVGLGLLGELDATLPDYFEYGQEQPLLESNFDDNDFTVGNIYSLSGALLGWDAQNIGAGEVIDIITYYGIGYDPRIVGDSLILIKLSGGDWTTRDCQLAGNPKEFQFLVKNNSPYAIDSLWVCIDFNKCSLVTEYAMYETSECVLDTGLGVSESETYTWLLYAFLDSCGTCTLTVTCSTNTVTGQNETLGVTGTYYSEIPCIGDNPPETEFIYPTNPFTACDSGDGLEFRFMFNDTLDDPELRRGVKAEETEGHIKIIRAGPVDSVDFDKVTFGEGLVSWQPVRGDTVGRYIIPLDNFDINYTTWDTIEVCITNVEDKNGCKDIGVCGTLYVDQDPPVIFDIDPFPNSFVSDSCRPRVYVGMGDSIAGSDTTLIWYRLDDYTRHYPYGTDNLTIKDLGDMDSVVLGFRPDFALNSGDTFTVCIDSIADLTDPFCGPNWFIDSCWSYFVDCEAPEISIVRPPVGQVISCETLTVIIAIDDISCIKEGHGVVKFNPGMTCSLATWDSVSWSCDTIFIYNVMNLWSGWIDVEVTGLMDSVGNVIDTFRFGYYVDPTGPVPELSSIGPPDLSVVSPKFACSLMVRETTAVAESTIVWHFHVRGGSDYEFEWGHGALSAWHQTPDSTKWWLKYRNTVGNIPLEHNDTLDCCLTNCDDIAMLCGANPLEGDSICWTYVIDAAGPEVRLLWPESLSISACDPTDPDFKVKLLITDPSGVDTASAAIRVDGTYHTESHSGIMNDTVEVTIAPTYDWPFCPESVSVNLIRVFDLLGNQTNNRWWHFWSDSTPPFSDSTTWYPQYISGAPCCSVHVSPYDVIHFEVDPGGCGGFFHDSMHVQIEITSHLPEIVDFWTYQDTIGYWEDNIYYIPIESLGVEDKDTVKINIAHLQDSLTYMGPCPPNIAENIADFRWCFCISMQGPYISRIRPTKHYVSCDSFRFAYRVADKNGLNLTTTRIIVRSESAGPDTFLWGCPQIDSSDIVWVEYPKECSLYFDIDIGDYADECETLRVTFDYIENSLPVPVPNMAANSFWVMLDTTAPCPTLFDPPEGDTLLTRTPLIAATIARNCAPLIVDSLAFSLDGGTTWIWKGDSSGAVYWETDTSVAYCDVSLLPESYWFEGGDTVEICVRNAEDTDFDIGCPLNRCTGCWEYMINSDKPAANPLAPVGGWIWACPTFDSLIIDLKGSSVGLNFNTAWVACTTRVNGLGYYWEWPAPELHALSERLSVVPASGFAVEDTYDVWIYILDSLENPLAGTSDGIYHYYFIVDHTPPDSVWTKPSCYGGMIPSMPPVLRLYAKDKWGLIDSTSWCVTFQNPDSADDWTTVCYENTTGAWSVYSDSAILETGYLIPWLLPAWEGGDSVTFFVSRICDIVDTCDQNCTTWVDTCKIWIPSQGPIISNVWPGGNGIIACDTPNIFIYALLDSEGVDTSTIEVHIWTCEGDTFVYDSLRFPVTRYIVGDLYDSLYFRMPPPIITEGCSFWVQIKAFDIVGNPEIDRVFSFIYDFTPPGFVIVHPDPADTAKSFIPEVIFAFPDSVAGVDTLTVTVSVFDWCSDSISVISPAPDTLEWRINTELGVPETLILSFEPLEHCLGTGDSVCLHVSLTDICDSPYICQNCTTLDSSWCMVIAQSGPQARIPVKLLCPEDSIELFFMDPEGVIIDSLHLWLNGVGEITYPAPGTLFWDDVSSRLLYKSPDPILVDPCTVKVWGVRDSMGYEMDTANFVLRVDLDPPEGLLDTPAPGGISALNQPDVFIAVWEHLSKIDSSCFVLSVGGTSYPYDGLILDWIRDTLHSSAVSDSGVLIWDAVAAGDTFRARDTVWVCLQDACDSTGCLDDNYLSPDSICWYFTIAEGEGPAVSNLSPPGCGMAVSCSTTFEMKWLITDTVVGLNPNNILVSLFNGLTVDSFTVDSAELSLFGDTLSLVIPTPTASGSLWVRIERLENTLGDPSPDIGDTCWFIIDWDAPYVENHWPADSETISSPYPVIYFIVKDSSWKNDITTGQVIINDTLVFTTDSSEVWWEDDTTLCFQPTIPFRGGDTVEFCIDSVADSTVICPPNWLTRQCWTFFINAEGPEVALMFPDTMLSPMIWFCRGWGHFWIINIDPEALDTDSVVVEWYKNSEPPVAVSWLDRPTLFEFIPGAGDTDTVKVANPALGAVQGDTICLHIITWMDTIGNPLLEDKTWCAVLDNEPPLIDANEPPQGARMEMWDPLIWAHFHDLASWVDHDSIKFEIRVNDALWRDSPYSLDDPEVWWNDDTAFFQPDTFFEEFAEICVYVTVFDSTTIEWPYNCRANFKTYHWCFWISDDDTIGPEVVTWKVEAEFWEWDTCFVPEGYDSFYILAALADTSGVFDDGSTDTTGQGLIAHIITATRDYWLPMELISVELDTFGAPGDSIYWATTDAGLIPGSEVVAGSLLCYEIWAYDNDFDFDNPDDRERRISDLRCCYIYNSVPPTTVINTPPAGAYISCRCGYQLAEVELHDTEPESILVDSLYLTVNGQPFIIGDPQVSYYVIPGSYPSVPRVTTISFEPDSANCWQHGDTITMCVHNVMDQWFNTSRDTCWEFYVDTLPPEAWCIGEYDTIVDIEEFDTMMFELFDLDAGVNESTIVLDVRVQSCTTGTNETFSFSMDDPSLVYDSTQNLLKLDISNNPSFFLYRGDSLFFSLKYAGDLTTVCYPNMLEDYYMCVKFIKPITRCYASPQPFTPNMDGYNDELSFDYPGRYDFEGKVFVYDLRSRLVAEINVSGPRKYIWDGRDINRVSVRPGVYLYVITGQGGKVLCRGTVVLAR